MTTAKAIVGAVVTGLSTVLTALTTGDQRLSTAVVIAAIIATLVAYGAVYQTPNAPAAASDKGETFVSLLYVVALCVVIVVGVVWLLARIG